jgi:transcriptional regulator with XRE-family HTH domain
MSALKQELMKEFRDSTDYREMYAEQHVNSLLAAQISTIREQRGLTQKDLAERINKQQPAISRFENVNYARWNVRTLREVANALGCWLNIRFESWGTLVEEAETFSSDSLRRHNFEDDPVFFGSEATGVPEQVRRVQKELFPWLLDTSDTAQLARWLQEPNLSADREYEPPFTAIQRAIEAEPATSLFRGLLVQRAIRLLREMLTSQASGVGTDEVYIGIFAVMAAFPSQEGWDALRKLYLAPREAHNILPQSSLPTFLAALIKNQMDGFLEEEWLRIISTGKDPWLPANHYDGFEGLKSIPPRPRYKSLVRGLRKLWYYSGRHPEANVNFQDIMEGLKYSFRGEVCFPELLFEEAYYEPQHSWHDSVTDAWFKVFASSEEERNRLLARVQPDFSRTIAGAISPYLSSQSNETEGYNNVGANDEVSIEASS